MEQPVENFLNHFGIKGMRWGVRRENPSESIPSSDDSNTASKAQNKAKIGGTKALSNAELQALVNRINLEQQYSRLKPKTASQKTAKFVADMMLNIGKQQASRLLNDQVGKLLGNVTNIRIKRRPRIPSTELVRF